MNILILGAGGMAGHAAALHFLERGHNVVGVARRRLPFCRTITADATRSDELLVALESGPCDAILNCVGVLNRAVDADPCAGIWLNSCLPHFLAAWTRGRATRLVHISTDCVFSGHDGGGYREDSPANAESMYGRSKALGEVVDDGNLTFRTSIVGPELAPEGTGLFNWFMHRDGIVPGYENAMWTGVTTMVLAQAIEAALAQNLAGLYHLANGTVISKYRVLQLFNALRERPAVVQGVDSELVDKSLVNTRRDFAFAVPSYEDMIAEMGRWIRERRELYPHYSVQ